MLRFSGAGVSDVGRVRPHNEDSAFHGPYVAVWPTASGAPPPARSPPPPRRTSSRHRAGAVRRRPRRRRWCAPFEDAHACLRPVSRATTSRAGMATTLTAVVTDGRGSCWGMSATAAPTSCATACCARSRRTTPTSSTSSTPASSTRDAVRSPVEQHRAALAGRRPGPGRRRHRAGRPAGDRLLLCSDGLTDLVADERIAEVLRLVDPHSAAAVLTQSALLAGGQDNITAWCSTSSTARWSSATGGCWARWSTCQRRRPGRVRLTSSCREVSDVERPALEGTVAVRGDRRLSFAEFGSPRGPGVVWMHGTPGARRQIPLEARAYAERARPAHHRPRPARDRVLDARTSTPTSSTGPATSSSCSTPSAIDTSG